MNNFGVFGIMPLTGVNHNLPPMGPDKSGKRSKKNEAPFTPAIFKEKVLTSGLLIASLPIIFMISQV